MTELQWKGCYEDRWKGLMVDAAHKHPAKFSRGLIRRIYQHAIAECWLAPGMTVLDPFGGVVLGALDAMAAGLHWRGVELESAFCALAQQNIDCWNRIYGREKRWGTARIIQGDSRRLREVLAGADCVLSSPPYAETNVGNDDAAGELRRLRAKRGTGSLGREHLRIIDRGPSPHMQALGSPYGQTPGQLGNLPTGDIAAVLSSPPYADGQVGTGADGRKGWRGYTDFGGGTSANPEQLSAMPAITFWEAACQIVLECHAILRPSGHAIWVCKDFVRGGAIVPFSQQWRQLCEHCGFEMIQHIKASLVNDVSHPGLFGEAITKRTARKSFFRRLHEKKRPDLAIDCEDVLVMRKS